METIPVLFFTAGKSHFPRHFLAMVVLAARSTICKPIEFSSTIPRNGHETERTEAYRRKENEV